jgi:CheY-like chemotaxis protein
LLVDDSAFFRNMLALVSRLPVIVSRWLRTVRKVSPSCGPVTRSTWCWTDIEMPEMNGFEFAEPSAQTVRESMPIHRALVGCPASHRACRLHDGSSTGPTDRR